MAYRNVLRPSSPLSAKASTRCPSFACSRRLPLDGPTVRRPGKSPNSPMRHAQETARRGRPPARAHPFGCITDPAARLPPSEGRTGRVVLGHKFSSHVKDPIPASAGTCVPSRGYRCRPLAAQPPRRPPWWRRTGSNRRPHACKARALPTELRPLSGPEEWWAREDLNFRPHAYQARARTN